MRSQAFWIQTLSPIAFTRGRRSCRAQRVLDPPPPAAGQQACCKPHCRVFVSSCLQLHLTAVNLRNKLLGRLSRATTAATPSDFCRRAGMHTCARGHAHMHAHVHAGMHTCMHTRTHSHAHTSLDSSKTAPRLPKTLLQASKDRP